MQTCQVVQRLFQADSEHLITKITNLTIKFNCSDESTYKTTQVQWQHNTSGQRMLMKGHIACCAIIADLISAFAA